MLISVVLHVAVTALRIWELTRYMWTLPVPFTTMTMPTSAVKCTYSCLGWVTLRPPVMMGSVQGSADISTCRHVPELKTPVLHDYG